MAQWGQRLAQQHLRLHVQRLVGGLIRWGERWRLTLASHSCSVNTQITRSEQRLESSRSPSVFQPLTLLQVDVFYHAERFLNATDCSRYVTGVHRASPPWHLNSRASDIVWVLKMSQSLNFCEKKARTVQRVASKWTWEVCV